MKGENNMSSSVNTNNLRKAIRDFQFYSTPSKANHSEPCTVGDIHKVINNMAKLMNTFVNEIEKSQ
jgi:hypothetical protein